MSAAGVAGAAVLPPVGSPVSVSTADLLALQHASRSISFAATRVRAREGGVYLSPFRGRGMEFEETRLYQPGDDLRSLDWRVTARTGKPHTKLFREERERPVLLWVDLRASMFFATRGAYKSVVAARAAAALAWSGLRHGDRIGGLIFSEHRHVELRPRRGHRAVLRLIEQLVQSPAWQEEQAIEAVHDAPAASALGRLCRVVRPGALVFLLSDFRHLGEEADAQIARLARHADVALVKLFDPLEAELPPAGRFRIVANGRELILDASDPARRAEHRRAFEDHVEHLRGLCHRNGMHLVPCSTVDDPVTVLARGLGQRR